MKITASVSVRRRSGKFPAASYARVLRPIIPRLKQDVEDAFSRKADPIDGRPWPDRKDPRPTHPLLILTGAMKRAAVTAAAAARVNGNTLYLRYTEPGYAKWHMLGTRKMPRRRFVGVSKVTAHRVRRALAAEGVRVFRNARAD